LCTALNGEQRRLYNGALDGAVVNDVNLPQGGSCACNGFQLDDRGNKVPLVAAGSMVAAIDSSNIWQCIPDPCFVEGTNSYYNVETQQCVCGTNSLGNTFYSWNTNNGLPTCQRDPCNPGGVTSPLQVKCGTDDDCSGNSAVVCNSADKACYIFTNKSCDPTVPTSCGSVIGSGGPQDTKCIQQTSTDFYCAVKDRTRTFDCRDSSECALGMCDNTSKLCTGGCICKSPLEPFETDANPLRSACSNPCVFNPCGVNGTCTATGTGDGPKAYTCACQQNFYGDSCELQICKAPDVACVHDMECCNQNCTFKFWPMQYTCD
jgi:hypothetical protein